MPLSVLSVLLLYRSVRHPQKLGAGVLFSDLFAVCVLRGVFFPIAKMIRTALVHCTELSF